MNDQTPIEEPADDVPEAEKPQFFFMIAALAVYRREDQVRQRHVNILVEKSVMHIAKSDLQEINTNVIARVAAENNVDPADVMDVVLLGVSILGHMTPSQFHGTGA